MLRSLPLVATWWRPILSEGPASSSVRVRPENRRCPDQHCGREAGEEVAAQFSTKEWPRFVAGSHGADHQIAISRTHLLR